MSMNESSKGNPTPRRKRRTAQEKLAIIQEARQAGQIISEVCRRHQIAAAQFYLWEKQARQAALQALRDGPRGRKATDPHLAMQVEVDRLRAAVAELSIENLQLKRGQWP